MNGIDWEQKFYKMMDEKNRYKDINKLFCRPVCKHLYLEYDPHGNIPRCKEAEKSYCEGICSKYEAISNPT